MIRPIEESDYLEVQILLDTLNKTSIIKEEQIKKDISRINKLDYIKLIGFEVDGKIVGMSTAARVEGLTYGGRPFTIIENVVVDSRFQGNGIGKKVVKEAIKQAKEWNSYKVILETGSNEEWKLSFYENCGLERGPKTAFIKRF